MKTLKDKLEALSVEYYDAYSRQDMTLFNSYTDSDWEGFYGNFGGQGFSSGEFSYDAGAVGTKMTIHSREWMISPELAVARSRETWTWHGSTGHYLITIVWRKRDGQWYSVHHHMSEYTP